MNWFYVVEGKQTGPVTETDFNELVRTGKIQPSTMVWREGMPDWKPYAQIQETAPPRLADQGGLVCAGCGQVFAPSDVIKLNHAWICAQCKPAFLQKMAEGVMTPASEGVWRQGRKLVTRSETPLPDRCVRCNEPANGFQLKRTLYWMNPFFYLLILCNLLVLLIVYLCVRKKAVLHVGFCEKHRVQRKNGLIIGWSGFGAGLLLLVAGIGIEKGWLALVGLGLLLIGPIVGGILARSINMTKMDKDGFVWIGGVNRKYLEELPEWPH